MKKDKENEKNNLQNKIKARVNSPHEASVFTDIVFFKENKLKTNGFEVLQKKIGKIEKVNSDTAKKRLSKVEQLRNKYEHIKLEMMRQKNEFLYQVRTVISDRITEKRCKLQLTEEEVATTIGCNTKYAYRLIEAGVRTMSVERFFLIVISFFQNRLEERDLFFNDLINDLSDLYFENKKTALKIEKSEEDVKIKKIREKLFEQSLLLDFSELKKIIGIMMILNKDKKIKKKKGFEHIDDNEFNETKEEEEEMMIDIDNVNDIE